MKTIRIACETKDSLPLESLEPFQGELKSLSKQSYAKLKKEILETGFAFPIYIWHSPENISFIIGGHQRVRTLKQMQQEGFLIPSIPVVKVHADDFQQAKRRIIQDVAQYGQLESQGLYEFMNDSNLGFDDLADSFRLPDINLDSFKLEYFEDPSVVEPQSDEDSIPEVKESFVKPGEIWILGNHRLMCGDSTDRLHVAKLMDNLKADMIFTDPPYNVGGECDMIAKNIRRNSYGKLKDAEWDQNFNLLSITPRFEEVISENSAIYVCTSHRLVSEVMTWMINWADMPGLCVWNKTNPMPSLSKRHWTWSSEFIAYGTKGKHVFNFPTDGHAPSVWAFPSQTNERVHPTQKPVAIPEHAIKHSSNPNALVVDLFLGSGTTIIACEKLNRKCYGLEIDPHYCGIIIERWQKYTGKEAHRMILT